MDYYKLANIKVHYNYMIFIVIIILLIIIILSCFLSCYDSYETYAVYNEGYLEVNVNLENSDVVDKTDYFKYQNEKIYYQIKNISGLNIIDTENYQIYQLKVTKKFHQNKIIKITFFYNKEKIITKILRIIF